MSVIAHNSSFGGAASAAVMLIAASARVAASLSALRAGPAPADGMDAAGAVPPLESPALLSLGETRIEPASPPTYSRPTSAHTGTATTPNTVAPVEPSAPPMDARLKATFLATEPTRQPTSLAVA